MTTTLKGVLIQGYIIQTWKAGDRFFEHTDIKAYAEKGQLPEAWEKVKADESIVEARIYRTSQIVKRADRRINADSFKRS
jgi:hypothetical protein